MTPPPPTSTLFPYTTLFRSRLTLDKLAEAPIGTREFRDNIIENQQCACSDNTAYQRSVRAGHGVLHCIADEQQQGEIERRHLADFAFPADAHADQHYAINDCRARRDFDQNMSAGKHRANLLSPEPARSSACSGNPRLFSCPPSRPPPRTACGRAQYRTESAR